MKPLARIAAIPAPRRRCALALTLFAAALAGCLSPNYQSIDNDLRHRLAANDAKISALTQKLADRTAATTELQNQLAAKYPPMQTLPPERLAELFTTAKIEIRNNTDAWDLGGAAGAGDGKGAGGISGFRIFVRTLSENDEIITATGTLTLEAFELPPSPSAPHRIGSWTFSPQEMKSNWYTGFGSDYYAFNCPWPAAPKVTAITFTANFTDALTGRHFEATMNKTIKLPPAAPAPTAGTR